MSLLGTDGMHHCANLATSIPDKTVFPTSKPLTSKKKFMGLSYYFSFSAPAETKASELEQFLKTVELDAKKMGFAPTMVLDAVFDTPERKDFARRLVTGFPVEDERLKGVTLINPGMLWHHDQRTGTGRVIPNRAVVIVLTDEQGCETVFGFLKYPEQVIDVNGKPLAKTGLENRWTFEEFVDTPDPRFRAVVKMFAKAGFLESEKDEFAS